MTKHRFFLLIIIALVLLNGVLLFLHFNRPDRRPGPRSIIIERLKFDDQQIGQFDDLVKIHQETSMANEDKINEVKNTLYLQLNNPSNALKIDSLAQNIAELQKNAEMINFKHFEDIKKICKPAQLPLFEKLTGELAQLFGKKKQEPKK
jgi:periplasmic protein CpxP/Spy